MPGFMQQVARMLQLRGSINEASALNAQPRKERFRGDHPLCAVDPNPIQKRNDSLNDSLILHPCPRFALSSKAYLPAARKNCLGTMAFFSSHFTPRLNTVPYCW